MTTPSSVSRTFFVPLVMPDQSATSKPRRFRVSLLTGIENAICVEEIRFDVTGAEYWGRIFVSGASINHVGEREAQELAQTAIWVVLRHLSAGRGEEKIETVLLEKHAPTFTPGV